MAAQKSNLAKYVKKRKFDVTPEPKGKVERSRGQLKFVIQKHQATRLHYDFRLEMEGVMKSWAVPKGPSLNPADKRLAMMTEDHPLSYRTFEGTIPEGEYGGGDVIVWDEGTYEAEGAASRKDSEQKLLAGLAKGDLKFVVYGQKIQGSFALVKMKGRQENAWLLIKHKDEYASKKNVVAEQSSARSNKFLGDEPHAKIRTGTKQARGSDKMPHDLKPMLATLTDEPFNDPEWLYEIKWDGYRAVAELEKGKVKLYSRNLQPFESKYPTVVQALEKIGHDAVLDGEITALDGTGRSRFEALQNYANDRSLLQYQIFDLLYLDGVDLRDRPLTERKDLLKSLLPPDSEVLRFSDHVAGKGKQMFAAAQKQGLEGIMAKDSRSHYATGLRSRSWLKIKTHNRQEAIICGYTAPRQSRKYFGAIILGVYREGKLVYIGHTGTGFNQESLEYLYKKLKKIEQPRPPFEQVPKTNEKPTWVKPQIVCEIEFTEWTKDGQMRHPSFKGLREDKSAKAVIKEQPMPPKSKTAAEPAGVDHASFTNLGKVYWPKEKYTKGDLIEYYKQIAPIILPYLKDRPQSMHRHPNGIKGPSFFQKNYTSEVPDFVDTFKFYSESNAADLRWLVVNNADALLYLANLGCIEINPWNSTTKKPEHPTWMVIDIDPDDNSRDEIVAVALATRKVLERAGVESYPKTSGKTGIHVFVPMGNKYDYDLVKQFAEIIANLVHREVPDFTSVERMPSKRRHKIYVDFLQNRVGQTLAAPYSLRPWPGATVSTPLKWSEVKKGWDPGKYTMKNIFQRLDKYGDLWKPVVSRGTDLKKALKNLS